MNYRAIVHVISLLLIFLSLGMASAGAVSQLQHDASSCSKIFFFCAGVTLAAALLGLLFARRRRGEREYKTGVREGFAAVAFSWLLASLFGALPFYCLADMTPADAIFETASGLTTTGASVIAETLTLNNGQLLSGGLESLPHGLLYWRCMLNWFGGVGIVFFVLLILPLMNYGKGNQLYNAEVPGLKTDSEQLTPRLLSSVRLILGVYLLLTFLATAVYWLGGMEVFDALCHAFATVSTGGFSTKAKSIGHYQSAFLQWSVIFFMFISACNFSLIVKMFITRKFLFFADEEFRFFAYLTCGASVLVALFLYAHCPAGIPGLNGTIPRSTEAFLRTAFFQVTSLISTTGFATSDYMQWGVTPVLLILWCIIFPCGCGGSTSGGIKCSRLIVIFKQVHSEIKRCLFSRTLSDVRLSGNRIEQSLVHKTMAFVLLYLLVFLGVGVALTFLVQADLQTALGAALACLSNVGPGFGAVGPAGHYAWLNAPAKYLLVFTMIAGRLELYTVLVLFLPAFWKR